MIYILIDTIGSIKEIMPYVSIILVLCFLISVLYYSIKSGRDCFDEKIEIEKIKKQNEIMKMKIEQKNLFKELNS